jgi:hypothetical protein
MQGKSKGQVFERLINQLLGFLQIVLMTKKNIEKRNRRHKIVVTMNTLQKSEVIYMVYREMAINPIRI